MGMDQLYGPCSTFGKLKMNKQYQLKIINCTDPMLWYRDKIGHAVPYVRTDSNFHWSRESEGYINIVYKEDAELIEVECDTN